ncbi:MAG: DUF3592 domain-containing protein [Cytophagaceae bacterium]|jgi:bifunctional pyridoxal-dependent enzyme with beta-cystathionase and maltose regulon repressor activities|nr:DUF3592 domain-containing protein [Cytophagaceae bacterium]
MHYIKIAFAFLIGILALWFGVKYVWYYWSVKNWTRVPAKVLEKSVYLHPTVTSSRAPYGIKVRYQYFIEHQPMEGNHVFLVELMRGQENYSQKAAEKKLASIPEEVMVYVNPKNPEASVMYCEGIGLFALVVAMGVFSILLGIAFCFKS